MSQGDDAMNPIQIAEETYRRLRHRSDGLVVEAN